MIIKKGESEHAEKTIVNDKCDGKGRRNIQCGNIRLEEMKEDGKNKREMDNDHVRGNHEYSTLSLESRIQGK